jgi:Domain of unknown function (DUF4440)
MQWYNKKVFVYSGMRTTVLLFIVILGFACATQKQAYKPVPYKPQDKALYDTIVRLDSILFHAYNICDLATYTALFSEDLEFYHDGGGLTTNKQESIEGYKKYVCGKVTRELLKGSIEVTPVPNHGAVEIGIHRFHNKQEPNAESHYARFVIIWKREKEKWVITRVISLH